MPLLEEALQVLGAGDSELRVRLLARLAGALRDQPSLEPRSSLAREATEIAGRLGNDETLGYALTSLATATWGPDPAPLLAIANEVSRIAEETGDVERELQAWWLHLIPPWTVGDAERTAAVTAEYQRLADRLKQPSQRWYGVILRCNLALATGDFGVGERLLAEGLELGARAQRWDSGFSYRVAGFVLRRDQGRLEEVEALIRDAVDRYRGYRLFPCLIAVLETELGRDDAARAALADLAANDFARFPPDGEYLFCLSLLAEVAAHLQDRDRAAVLYELLTPHRRLHATASGETSLGAVARYLGVLATTLERWSEGEQHFEDALGSNGRAGARPWLAHTQQDYGQLLLARDGPGDRERARMLLADALATYEELGMTAAAARVPSAVAARSRG